MLLNSVIIVSREVLEAALILSVLLATSRFLRLSPRWALAGLAGGLVGASVYGANMHSISDLLDGVGQEVIDASLQFSVYASLLGCTFLMVRRFRQPQHGHRVLPALMAVAVALAVSREGSEILIYVTGFWELDAVFSSVGIGSVVGGSIGMSVGVLFYYLLLSQPLSRALPFAVVLVALIGAGMCGQAAGLLIQADWLSAGGPVWNTSAALPEDSLPGQLLYALIGYEASPSAMEVSIYLTSLVLTAVAVVAGAAGWARNRGGSL